MADSSKKAESQIDKFRAAARELEADQSEEAFDAIVTKIAKAPKLSDEEIKKIAKRYREQSGRQNREKR